MKRRDMLISTGVTLLMPSAVALSQFAPAEEKRGKTSYIDPVAGDDAADGLRVLAAVKPPLQATTNLAAVFDLTDDGENLDLSFTQFHPMPGGQVKFCIIWDDVSERLKFLSVVSYQSTEYRQWGKGDRQDEEEERRREWPVAFVRFSPDFLNPTNPRANSWRSG